MTCRISKDEYQTNSCTGCEFIKDGLCDFPFSLGMVKANKGSLKEMLGKGRYPQARREITVIGDKR